MASHIDVTDIQYRYRDSGNNHISNSFAPKAQINNKQIK